MRLYVLAVAWIYCFSVAVSPSCADIVVPGDADGDKLVSDEELEAAKRLSSEGKITDVQLEEIRDVHENYPKSIIDSVNNTITIYAPIKRAVVAYWIGGAITLQALNAEDSVVGVSDSIASDDSNLFPRLSRLPSVGKVPTFDVEKILELEPDLVITGAADKSYDDLQEKIQSLNPDVPVLRFDYCRPASYIDEVNKTGYIFGREKEAKEMIQFFETHLGQIKNRVGMISHDKRVRVYSEVFRDYATGGTGSYYPNDYIEMAGGDNIFGDTYQGLFMADAEEVIKRDPDIILHHLGAVHQKGWGTDSVAALREKRADIINRSGFAGISAIENGKVYALDANIVIEAFYPVGLSYYAKWFYPDLFNDIDPNEIHQEFLDRFLHIDYDLSKHGVFVYHPKEHPLGR
ncbi:MAG TPA: ABC transporter substrate-binding protein [Methanotrichaceae archaeon]|nr:ABC transporter substrate-binding protein [Methanotrichaceae archaeon]HQF15750.1 ABC transporter substrate-binding protein [Methanotrichaceae archaeon]HQI90577.1 ABC transporter substrate-binding protein [Methanotrichaceae archaeon]